MRHFVEHLLGFSDVLGLAQRAEQAVERGEVGGDAVLVHDGEGVEGLVELLGAGVLAHDDCEGLRVEEGAALHVGDEVPHEAVLADLGEGGDREVVGLDGVDEGGLVVAVGVGVGPLEEAVREDAGVVEAGEDLLGGVGGEGDVGLGEGLLEDGLWGGEHDLGDEGDGVRRGSVSLSESLPM